MGATATENTLNLAELAMTQAKARFSQAALACLRNALDAPAQVQRALQEVDRARAMLRYAADTSLEASPAKQKAIAPRSRVSLGRPNRRRAWAISPRSAFCSSPMRCGSSS